MSKVVDTRVTEMIFDNARFEKNVAQSMSTLKKLKQSLKLDGAAKGLENVGKQAEKVDLSGMTKGVEKCRFQFSALQVAGVTAMQDLTRTTMRFGRRIADALFFESPRSGFQEYETQLNAVQTILANTQSKGTTLDQVNAALDELNTYADKTIYNFTEMTRNIGTFTAAGVDLDKSVRAIKGIANLAAVSGSSSQQASNAMYQLSQALAAGKVSLMDWNSVVNAGMGGQVFQDALIRTANHMGKNVDALIEKYGSFRESLTQGEWLTTEVLTETLSQLAGAYSEAELIQQGYTEQQAKEIAQMAKTAEDAATKVKMFTQLIETTKEQLQSGWTQTWEIIIGDFEQSKELFTRISDFLGEFISKTSEARNSVLTEVMTSKWDKLTKQIKESEIEIDAFESKLAEIYDTGYGSGASEKLLNRHKTWEKAFRSNAVSVGILRLALDDLGKTKLDLSLVDAGVALGKTGDDVKQIQEALSSLGYDIGKTGADGIFGANTESAIKAFQEAKGLEITGIIDEETLTALNQAGESTSKLLENIDGLLNGLDEFGGRELLIESFGNVVKAFGKAIAPISKGFKTIFPVDSAAILKSLIERFHSFTEGLIITDSTVGKVYKTFKGLFALIDIIGRVVGTIGKKGFFAFSKILSPLGKASGGLLKFTAGIGNAIIDFREWLIATDSIDAAIDTLALTMAIGFKSMKLWFDELLAIPEVQKFLEPITTAIENFKNLDMSEIGTNMFEGLKLGLQNGITQIPVLMIEWGTALLTAICDVLGIHSPSTEFFDIAVNCILGFINGIQSMFMAPVNLVKSLGSKILSVIDTYAPGAKEKLTDLADSLFGFLGDINYDEVIARGTIFGTILFIAKQISKVTKSLTPVMKALEGVGELMKSTGGMFSSAAGVLDSAKKMIDELIVPFQKTIKNFGKILKSIAFEHNTEGLLNLSLAIGVLAGVVLAISHFKTDDMWEAVGVIGALAGILLGLSVAMSKLGGSATEIGKNGVSVKKALPSIVGIGAALLLMAMAMEKIGKLDPTQYVNAMQGFVVMIGSIVSIMYLFGNISKIGAVKSFNEMGEMLLKLSWTMLVLIGVCKLAGTLNSNDALNGIMFASAFTLFVFTLSALSNVAGKRNLDELGKMILKISVAIGLLVGVCKLAGLLEYGEMAKGAVFAAGCVAFVAGLTKVTQVGNNKQIAKLGSLILSISIALGIMVGTFKLIDLLSLGEIIKGTVVTVAFTGWIAILMGITKISNEQKMGKVGGTLLAMSVSIGIMAGIAILLGMVELGNLAKGVVAVGMLGLVMAAMTAATRDAGNAKSSILAMSVAIGVMAGAIAALSLLNPESLVAPTVALTTLMGMFAVIAKSSSGIDGSSKTILAMTFAVGALSGCLYLLAGLPIEGVIASAISLSLVMGIFAKTLATINGMKPVTLKSLGSIAGMALVVAGLGVIIGAMSALAPVEGMIPAAISLSALLLALTAAMTILTKANLNPGTTAMAAASLGAFVAVLIAIAGVVVAIGGVFAQIEGSVKFMQDGGNFLQAIGTAIGQFVGGIWGGIGKGVAESLPSLGENISIFAEKLGGFMTSMSTVDGGIITNASNLATAILALTAANFLSGLSDFLGFTGSFETLGTQLSAFANAMIVFSTALKDGSIDQESINAAANAGKMFAELQNGIAPSGGVIQNIFGEKDLGSFGRQLLLFGKALVHFSNTVKGKLDQDSITAAANAGKTMSELQAALTPTGGVVQDIFGERDMAGFGRQLVPFGKALVNFSNTVKGKIDEDAVESAANAGEIMAKMQSNIDPSGSVWEVFTGTKDMAALGRQLVPFGKAMVHFSNTVKGKIDTTSVEAAASAGKMMAGLQSSLEPSGGVIKDIFGGDKNLEDFGSNLEMFGGSIVKFADKVKDLTDVTVMDNAIGIAKSVIALAKDIYDSTDDINSGLLGMSALSTLGDELDTYYQYLKGIDLPTITTSAMVISMLASAISSTEGLSTEGIDSFKSALSSLAQTDLSGIATAFSNSETDFSSIGTNMMNSISSGLTAETEAITLSMDTIVSTILDTCSTRAVDFGTAGQTFIVQMILGITGKLESAKIAVQMIVSSAASVIASFYNSFYQNGEYLGAGLVLGIRSMKQHVYDEAYALGQEAVKGEQDGQDSHSPSVPMIQSGKWIGEGLIIGLRKMGSAVYSAGHAMGENATDSISDSIAKISDMLNSDMSTAPSIRPVLDLTNVAAGVDSITRMLSFNPHMGVMADVQAVNDRINNTRNRNNNDDVISALKKFASQFSGERVQVTINLAYNASDDAATIANDIALGLEKALRRG